MNYTRLLTQENYMILPKPLVRAIGLSNTIVLSNLCSIANKYGEEFFFTQTELAETCCINIDTLKKSIAFFKEAGVLQVIRKGIPCRNFYSFIGIDEYIENIYDLTEKSANKSNANTTNKLAEKPANCIREKSANYIAEKSANYINNANINNTDKEDNNKVNKFTFSSSSSADEAENKNLELMDISKNKTNKISPNQFEWFWSIYPKKVDKGKAKTKWNQLCKDKDRPSRIEIKRAIENQKNSDRWQDPQFIPHPTTWLNQSRWLDDANEMQTRKQTSQEEPTSCLPHNSSKMNNILLNTIKAEQNKCKESN